MDFFIKINLIIEKFKKAKIVVFLLRMRKGRSFGGRFSHVLSRVQEAEFREQGAIVFLRFDCHIYRYYELYI